MCHFLFCVLYGITLETMPARSVQRADIHEANLLQSGTALFLVKGFVFHDSHSRSNISLALIVRYHSTPTPRHTDGRNEKEAENMECET